MLKYCQSVVGNGDYLCWLAYRPPVIFAGRHPRRGPNGRAPARTTNRFPPPRCASAIQIVDLRIVDPRGRRRGVVSQVRCPANLQMSGRNRSKSAFLAINYSAQFACFSTEKFVNQHGYRVRLYLDSFCAGSISAVRKWLSLLAGGR